MKQKICQNCGAELVGRADKKFCNDQCRNEHNNSQNRDVTNYIRNVNNQLRRNRKAIVELFKGPKTKIHKDQLMLKGYNFQYATNTFVNKTGGKYTFCYDMGLLDLGNDFFMIVKRKDAPE